MLCCYVMLCYVMLCYVMLCYVMLCYVMLCYVMLCYVMLCCAVLCCAVLCCSVLCCAVLCCAVLCCAVLCCAVLSLLCCVKLCYAMPYEAGYEVGNAAVNIYLTLISITFLLTRVFAYFTAFQQLIQNKAQAIFPPQRLSMPLSPPSRYLLPVLANTSTRSNWSF